nr:vegetative cell wall protein gp1-like [Aegilops tauschii subsp. strangulata]
MRPVSLPWLRLRTVAASLCPTRAFASSCVFPFACRYLQPPAPSSSGFGPFGAGPRTPFMERCAAAAPGAPPARRPLPPPPGFVTPSPEVESERAPGPPSPSYEVEPGTPPAHPKTGTTSPSPVASSAAAARLPPLPPRHPPALLPRHLA